MRKTMLRYAGASIGEAEIAAVNDVLRSGWLTCGPKVTEFETAFAQYLGVPKAVALNSCTAGLHLALMFYGIRPGDEVITSTLTFAATAAVIEHMGAKPVFADIEADTLNMAPWAALPVGNARTRAIIPVHFAGHPADLAGMEALAYTLHAHMVEDAAHALGASYKGVKIGAGKFPAAFSFYVTKNLTTLDGGMLVGAGSLLGDARLRRLHGVDKDSAARETDWDYDVVLPGLKYNMTDVDAAIGLVQLGRFDTFQQRRAQIAGRYNEAFAFHDALECPTVRPDCVHAWHIYTLRLNLKTLTIKRDPFMRELRKRNIGCQVHFKPLHLMSYYRAKYHLTPDMFPVASREYKRLISLPLYPAMTDEDVTDVIEAVLEICKTHRR